MKVKFENALVDIWKLRKGVVVRASGGYHYIKNIGLPNTDVFDEGVIAIDLENTDRLTYVMSTDVEWLEPH